MGNKINNFMFQGMSFFFKIRDLLIPRKRVLEEAGINPGFHVLDFGCGPGGYILGTAELIGKAGKIYALDINPLALERVRRIAEKNNLSNLETIHSNIETGLDDGSVDVVLLYDVFHHLKDPVGVLRGIHRILRPEGILSFSDHHMKEEEILSGVTEGGLFQMDDKGKKTYRFLKNTI